MDDGTFEERHRPLWERLAATKPLALEYNKSGWRWSTTPWFPLEHYFYRRILFECRTAAPGLVAADPFEELKIKATSAALSEFTATALPLATLFASLGPDNRHSLRCLSWYARSSIVCRTNV